MTLLKIFIIVICSLLCVLMLCTAIGFQLMYNDLRKQRNDKNAALNEILDILKEIDDEHNKQL